MDIAEYYIISIIISLTSTPDTLRYNVFLCHINILSHENIFKFLNCRIIKKFILILIKVSIHNLIYYI